MKVFLLLAVCLLSLLNVIGAKRSAMYKLVRCNPKDGDANCVTHKTKEMEWNSDLPMKLPASTAQYLEAEPVEDESPTWSEEEAKEDKEEDEEWQENNDEDDEYDDWELEDEDEMYEDEKPVMVEESESPLSAPSQENSGVYEGSAGEGSFSDEGPAESGSGEPWLENKLPKVGDLSGLRRLFPSTSLVGKAKPEDLKQDQLL